MYELKPEYAGRLLECPACGRHLRAGPPPGLARLYAGLVDPAFDRDVFLLRERVFTIRSKYEAWAEDGTPILYVERPTYLIRTLFAYFLGAQLFPESLWPGRNIEGEAESAAPPRAVRS